jgi:hypothetical protein
MSSFYDKTMPTITPRIHLKSIQKAPNNPMLHISSSGGIQAACSGPSTSAATLNHTQRHAVTQVEANTSITVDTPTNIPRQPPLLPPLRRVVKFAIQPHVVTIGVAVCAALNTVLSVVTPSTVTPPLGTTWGCFLYLWLLITLVQFVTHSVYLCTSTARFVSVLHMAVVALSTVLLPRSMFARSLWIAPCLCTVLVSYQCYIFCLVYTNLHNAWVYVVAGVLFVLTPMTQLISIGVADDTALSVATLWSAISIYTLYAFALANSRKAVLVDVIVGTSPTTQLQE